MLKIFNKEISIFWILIPLLLIYLILHIGWKDYTTCGVCVDKFVTGQHDVAYYHILYKCENGEVKTDNSTNASQYVNTRIGETYCWSDGTFYWKK